MNLAYHQGQCDDWRSFLEHVNKAVAHKYQVKKQNLIKKFEKLRETSTPKSKKAYFKKVEHVDNFVRNMSDVTFSDGEMELLNRSFKFALQQNKQTTLENTLINFETAIGHLDEKRKFK